MSNSLIIFPFSSFVGEHHRPFAHCSCLCFVLVISYLSFDISAGPNLSLDVSKKLALRSSKIFDSRSELVFPLSHRFLHLDFAIGTLSFDI